VSGELTVEAVVSLLRRGRALREEALALGVRIQHPSVHNVPRRVFDAFPSRGGTTEWRRKDRVYWTRDSDEAAGEAIFTEEPPSEASPPVQTVVELEARSS
jgi:hypothetical protein